jgi:hypothetical protein
MRRLILAAFASLSVACLADRASSQGLERICVSTIDPNTGAIRCVEGWVPMLLNGLSATVTSVKGAAGQLGSIYCYNPNASVAYIQVFDAATPAAVTLGTTAPKVSFGIAATSSGSLPLSAMGIEFLSGIQAAVTTTATGSTAPSAGMDCSAVFN